MIQVNDGSVVVPSASTAIAVGPSTIKTVIDNTTVFALATATVLNLDFEDEVNYDANWSFSGSSNQHSQGTRSDNNTSFLKLYGNGAGAGGTRTTLAKYSAIPQISGSYNVTLDWYARVGYHNSTCYVKLLDGTTSLFSIEAPNAENQQNTTAYVYGNPKGEALGSFTVAARNINIDSDSGYWYTVRVDADVTKGIVLTILKPDKTVVFGPTVVSEYLAVTGIEVQQESAKGADAHGGIDNICITVPAKAMFGFGGYKTLQDAINEASASLESIKTVTLLDNVTEDITLSTPGIVVSLGSFVITGTVSAGSGMVVTYDDVAKTWTCEADTSTYTWTNETGNSLWSDPGNWLAGSAVAAAAPTPEKLIVFPATAGSWSVILAENVSVASVQFNGNTTLSGGLIVSDVITAADGVVVTLGEGGGFMESSAEITIAVNIEVAGTQAAPSVLRGYSHINTYSGNLTGSGWIELQAHNDLCGIKMTGDNSAFSGTVVVPAAELSANRTACGITPSASSANATFIINGAGKWNENKERSSFLKGSNGTYYFGSIVGTLLADSTQQRNNTVYVGYLDSNSDAVAGHLAYETANHDRGQTFHKVGTGTMTYTATRAYNIYLDEGTLNMAVADPLVYSSIVFNGGALKLAEACTADLSSQFVFVADKAATIDDDGVPRTFATAIGSSVAANFTKKGAGALTLAAPPTYTGTTKVEDGVLYVINGDYTLTLDSSTAEVTTDKDGYRKFVPASVAISAPTVVWGDDFAKVTVSAEVTSNYGEGGLTYNLKIGGNVVDGAVGTVNNGVVTFSDVNVSGLNLSRYGDVSVEVTASAGGSQAATSGLKNVMFADTIGWVNENYETTTTAAAGGAWQTDVTYDATTHKAAVVDNRFSATNCTTGDVVTVTIDDVVYATLSNLSDSDMDAQGAIAVGGTEEAPKFVLLTKQGDTVGWYEAAGVTPVLENEAYDIVMTFDYNSNTYTVTVNGTPLTVGGAAAVPLAKAQTSVKDIDFLGAGSLAAVNGVQYEGKMAIDQNGRKYATVAEALEANASVKGAVIKLLHGSATTSAEGWNFDSDTKTFVKKVIGLIFLAF